MIPSLSLLPKTLTARALRRLASYALAFGLAVMLTPGVSAAAPEPRGQAARPTPSGLPVPRFASLKSERVFVRQGPSNDNPVSWVYVRKGWPVEVIAEQAPCSSPYI